MITRADIEERVREWGLAEEVVEKDYVLGWVLWGIGTEPALAESWVFKGGTCLKKCYLETYRFSEDLDFTVLPGGPILPEEVLAPLRRDRRPFASTCLHRKFWRVPPYEEQSLIHMAICFQPPEA